MNNEKDNPQSVSQSVSQSVRVHCLFEQSGTFKKQFNELGFTAYDYDILNDFGETDYVVDLFAEIESAFNGNDSIFDSFTENDLIMAFFPCVRFENQVMLWFRGQCYSQKNWSIIRKMEKCMELQKELTRNYNLVNMLFLICTKRNLRLVMENPYSQEHYLRRYWCVEPTIIDTDRRLNGDYYKKPTQYWFVNIKPYDNTLEPLEEDNFINEPDAIRKLNSTKFKNQTGMWVDKTVLRSMIHPTYANRFIRKYLMKGTKVEERQMKITDFL